MWVQISAGQGSDECALAVGHFLKVLLKECREKAIEAEVIHTIPGRYVGDVKSALLSINGCRVENFAKEIEGTVCWVCKSPYRPGHKRKNWFIDVKVFQEETRLEFTENDLEVEFTRSSGPGGQNVNKVETTVKVIHMPTGLAVTASEERSQLLNRKLAFARLAQLQYRVSRGQVH